MDEMVGGQGPSGTVAVLFTDIVGSTERWQRDERGMSLALARHDEVLRSIVAQHGGVVFKHTGDGVAAAFPTAASAAQAAADAQGSVELPVRFGLHVGAVEVRGGDYFGTTVNVA